MGFELSKFSKINLIHRRDDFRGAPHTLSEIKKLEKEGKISIKTPCQLESIEGKIILLRLQLNLMKVKLKKLKQILF